MIRHGSARDATEVTGSMEKLGIYEYVAVIVPGVVFLFGLGVMLPEAEQFRAVLMPQDLGAATVHLFLAFALGHLLQVIGQLLHGHYWSDFGGMPTDWPLTRQHQELSPKCEQLVLEATGETKAETLADWRRAVAAVRSLVTSDGFGRRLETFQANYGMFRSIVVAGILLLLATPWCDVDLWYTCPMICVVIVVSLLGMHRFGVHYAKELFAAVRAWTQMRATLGNGTARSAQLQESNHQGQHAAETFDPSAGRVRVRRAEAA